VLPKVPHEKLNQYYWNADVVIDRFKLGSLGMVSLEAIACGRPVVTYVSSEYSEYKDFPLQGVTKEEDIVNTISDDTLTLWKKEYTYLEKNHNTKCIVEKLLSIYKDVNKG
jgi:glycosyltransferase involved in cell wall biosynthesis